VNDRDQEAEGGDRDGEGGDDGDVVEMMAEMAVVEVEMMVI